MKNWFIMGIGAVALVCQPSSWLTSSWAAEPAKPGAALDGYRFEFPCKEAMPENPKVGATCSSAVVTGDPMKTDNFTVQKAFGGKPGKRYKVTLRVRGVVEPMMYKGGEQVGEYFYIGGEKNNGTYNIYEIKVSSPESHYYLNRQDKVGHQIFAMDYTQTIEIDGGATITLHGDGQNGQMIANFKKLVVPNVAPAPLPFNGQFVQINVVDVKQGSSVQSDRPSQQIGIAMQENPYRTPLEANSFFEKRPGVLVLLCGVATSLLTLAALYWLDHATIFHVMGYYVSFILPVGALGVGILAGSGYGLASWLSGAKISRGLFVTVAILQIAVYFTALYFEYLLLDDQLPNGLQMSFWQYFDAVSQAFAWEKNGQAGQPFGIWGYGMRALEIAGFACGGLFAPAMLLGLPYCDACQIYMGTRKVAFIPVGGPAPTFKKKDVAAKRDYEQQARLTAERSQQVIEEINRLFEARDIAGLGKLLRENKFDKKIAKTNNHYRVDLARCKRCWSGLLLINLLTIMGKDAKTTKVNSMAMEASTVGELDGYLTKPADA